MIYPLPWWLGVIMNLKSIVAWNIQHGGGSGERGRKIVSELAGLKADVIVLTEFRNNSTGTLIKARLAELGYSVSHPAAPERANSVLIASRNKIIVSYPLDPELTDQRHLWVVDLGWLKLCGIYMPLDIAKLPYWEALHRAAVDEKGADLFIGDFNTGNNIIDRAPGATPFIASEYFDEFGKGRLRDVWRAMNPEVREYTWYSLRAKNGFRLDHAFATASVFDRITRCEYVHDARERRLSDHSALRMVITTDSPQKIAAAQRARSVIYTIKDPIRPDLLKIGKDNKWPQRLRQAQSHSPRELAVAGTWSVDRDEAAAIERRILNAFPRVDETDGVEWVSGGPNPVARISGILNQLPDPQAQIEIRPFDDWRDYVKPIRSNRQRRLWIGQERKTGRLKVVHSPHVDNFHRICPTFSCLGFRWVAAWQFPAEMWERSAALHATDAAIVDMWSRIVNRDGFGENSPRVGWLREGIRHDAMTQLFLENGLIPFHVGKNRNGKTFVDFSSVDSVNPVSP